MKTSVSISKVVVFFVFVLTCAFASASEIGKDYKWVDNVENGQLMSREIMKQNSRGKYVPVHKYEYSYNINGDVAEKMIYAWNTQKNVWMKQSFTQITYDGSQVVMEVSKWKNPERNISSVERMVFVKNQNDELVLNYVFEKKADKWVVKNEKLLTNK